MKVRTRVAPSPTGDPHVGTAYMALFSMCLAHSQQGEFVLRIEDTDASRSSSESEQNILHSLKWLGLEWDEGPDVGGPHAPYRQSERLDIYQQHVKILLEKGHAFHCFCTPDRLDEMRKQQMALKQTARYDGHCINLPPAEVQARLAAGSDYVVRMKVPESGTCVVKDLLRGDIEIDWSQVDMQVLQKADGYPTYHLAVVVDDHLMEISHIIRGEEWINSAPKHMLLSEYFGWQMPVFIHMNLLRNPDKSKLSKRKNPTSIGFYRQMGFMPEAVINYLGVLGYSMPDGREKFSLQEMLDDFDIQRISLGAPVFDVKKLAWLNGRWIREELDDDAFAERVSEWALNPNNLKRVVPLIKERIDTFSEIAPMTSFLFAGLLDLAAEDFQHKKVSGEDMKRILQFTLWRSEDLAEWNRDAINHLFVELADGLEIKLADCLIPIFIAISGKTVAPPLFDSMAVLGAEISRARIKQAIEVLGGVSKKESKRLERELRDFD
ncbi:MAG: glutamate--tRNA ligase [Pseudomonadales bacterium]|jgi:glutamyl-tRNA synthetase|nr:glutamate--tRNA ligase [Gammaproteobacteria bacterium]MDP6264897.1 glutamate--tRNA ligase [Pseudomonadales bacterium]HJN50828.1 glutamate--tRNA ligase [Pseudomonadales bacterium]|tara:strand:- start:246 stop:1727 length:1482 start_codon:yes stop_codon:yes gene_type:complete